MSKQSQKNVWTVLKSFNKFEYTLLKHSINFRDKLEVCIKEGKMTKEDVCKYFEIKPQQYNNFCIGAFDYDMGHIVKLNNLAWEQYMNDEMKPFQLTK